MNWENRKEFPKDAYKEFVIRFRWKHNGENLQWTYLVVHTAMMPTPFFDKEWEWLDESAHPTPAILDKNLPRKHDWIEVPVELKRILNKYVGPDNSNKTKKDRLACGSEIMNWIENEKQQK